MIDKQTQMIYELVKERTLKAAASVLHVYTATCRPLSAATCGRRSEVRLAGADDSRLGVPAAADAGAVDALAAAPDADSLHARHQSGAHTAGAPARQRRL